MTTYNAPIKQMVHTMKTLGFEFDTLEEDDVNAILDEANKLASDVLAPLNHPGDQEGLKFENGKITMPKGFKEAYSQYRDNGWNTVPFPEEFGGQEMPWAISFPIQEMWQSANMAFGLCPLLNQGAVDTIMHHGSDDLKQTYLEKMITGEWTGTMNLTEPQAGSDLSKVTTKAIKQDDGSYKITGQKIYITYGEHDMADNIVHLVLARTPDAPEGTKGISLFVVPKYMVNDDGSIGDRNDLVCVNTEHKLGIHASPTCTMSFGDNGGATGYLVGNENEGLTNMFTMMNNARLSVGLQGVAIAERAYQQALDYANERVQGGFPIVNHPDVARMLMSMRVLIEAGRALTYDAVLAFDKSLKGDKEALAKVSLLTPIVKNFGTDHALEVTSTGVQIHGGMGFVEETGAAQHYRDARILPIYEGTNGIQSMDFTFRKIRKDGGAVAKAYIKQLREGSNKEINPYLDELEKSIDHVVKLPDAQAAYACTSLSQQFGYVAGAVMLNKLAVSAKKDSDKSFAKDRAESYTFYRDFILPRAKTNAAQTLSVKKDTQVPRLAVA